MSTFDKGNFKPVPETFRTHGILALRDLSKFQDEFQMYDTDTTINTIRDAIIANYLDYDLLNYDKHGFDAKKSEGEHFLEVKQCSISSNGWGGTWNDTTEEKALEFSDIRLSTAVGLWKGASDLQFMVFGQHEALGAKLYNLVVGRKEGSRSTQTISIMMLIRDFGFRVVCPPDKTKEEIKVLMCSNNRNYYYLLNDNNILDINEL